MFTRLRGKSGAYIASILLALGTFVFDVLLPRGAATAIGYCVVLTVALATRNKRFILLIAILTSVFTVLAHFLESPIEPHWVPLLDRWMVVIAIWLTAGLVITHVKRERAIRMSEHEFRAIFEFAGTGKAQMELQTGRFLRVNRKICEMMGYPSDELLRIKLEDLIHPEDREIFRTRWANLAAGRVEGASGERRFVRKDGGVIWVFWTAKVIQDCAGRSWHVTAVMHDITDRKHAEQALARQARELEQKSAELARSNDELEQFATVASHDLRSPLSSIKGCLDLLEMGSLERLSPEDQEVLRMAQGSVRRMQEQVQSFLEYAHAGSSGLKLGRCSVEGILAEVTDALSALRRETGAEITHDPLPEVLADDRLMAALLQNLIENAVKYRREDPPKIHVSARSEDDHWVFSVRDNGGGIAPQYFESIFQMYRRAGNTSGHTGFGVGLATCRKIVERHGGRIWVESVVGQGSTFFFTIPMSTECNGAETSSKDGEPAVARG